MTERNMILGPIDHLTLREQVKLVEIANGASDYRVRAHALSILNAYRNPPVMHVDAEKPRKEG
jgi:hypothetical protein